MRGMKRTLLFSSILFIGPRVFAETYTDDFESGYTPGTNLSTYSPMWYGDGGTLSPTIQTAQGVADSIGLSAAQKTFTWAGRPFTWTDPTVTGVVVSMDFKTPATADFRDDRIGWRTQPNTSDEGYTFGVQLGKDGTTGNARFQGYFKSSPTGTTRTPLIALIPTAIQANAWYRFRAEFTKLTDTSTKIDVSLQELDALGNPGAIIGTGSVADSSVVAGTWDRTPRADLFTATNLYPCFKNYDQVSAAPADNAYFQVLRTIPDCASTVLPNTDQLATAEIGQASTPISFDYTFTNAGFATNTFTVEELDAAQQPTNLSWLSLNTTGSTVASQASVTVTASIDSTSMPGGRHTGYLRFSDSCSPPNVYLRRIDLDVYGCHWTVDSCTQERAYLLDYPGVLPQDVVYRITNTGTSSLNYDVTKSGSASLCFEWLNLTNASGTIPPGGHADVVAHIDVGALVGFETDQVYECTLNFSDTCSPLTATRKVTLRYLGIGDTQVFTYVGDTLPTNDDSAGPGLRFDLDTNDQYNGFVEADPDADNDTVWRMVDSFGAMRTFYRATFRDPEGSWERVRERSDVGSTIVSRLRVRSLGPVGGTERAVLAIAEQYSASAGYHWGGTSGKVVETRRALSALTGLGTDEFVTLRLTTQGRDETLTGDCIRIVRLYLNENPTPVLEILNAIPKGTGLSGDRGLWFGDSDTAQEIDVAFDWVSGTNAGAFAPGAEVAVIGKSLVPVFEGYVDCEAPVADIDKDGDVDSDDFGEFQRCYTGAGVASPNPACGCLDRDNDDDIDDLDFAAWANCRTGPSVPFNLNAPPANCVP